MPELPVHPSHEPEIAQIVFDVFTSMLRCGAELVPGNHVEEFGELAVAVSFSGNSEGLVLLECTEQAARSLASLLMRLAPVQVTASDALDAMGEIVNMIGGNLKSVLLHGAVLSLPSVVEEAGYGSLIRGAYPCETLIFKSAAGRFQITFLQTKAAIPGCRSISSTVQ